jgi:hypothetical protein
MSCNHGPRILLIILTLLAGVVSLACSPSQQPEQANPATTGPARPETITEDQSVSTESAPSSMHAADSAPFAIHTPEMWEVKIARMLAEGHIDEADEELQKLKQEFPDYELNPTLIDNLNKYHE